MIKSKILSLFMVGIVTLSLISDVLANPIDMLHYQLSPKSLSDDIFMSFLQKNQTLNEFLTNNELSLNISFLKNHELKNLLDDCYNIDSSYKIYFVQNDSDEPFIITNSKDKYELKPVKKNVFMRKLAELRSNSNKKEYFSFTFEARAISLSAFACFMIYFFINFEMSYLLPTLLLIFAICYIFFKSHNYNKGQVYEFEVESLFYTMLLSAILIFFLFGPQTVIGIAFFVFLIFGFSNGLKSDNIISLIVTGISFKVPEVFLFAALIMLLFPPELTLWYNRYKRVKSLEDFYQFFYKEHNRDNFYIFPQKQSYRSC